MSLHKCTYEGRTKWLLALENPENAAMPACALINYLSLKDEQGLPAQKRGKEPDMTEELSILLNRASEARNIPVPPDDVLNSLTVDTTIKPYCYGSILEFTHDEDECVEDKALFSLCESLGIKLYHGCIVNPEDPASVVERQLTQYGLDYLTREITEGELALFFRDGYLNIIRKYAGYLFLLETDKITLDKRDESMWKLLTLHEHQEILFTKSFSPIKMAFQPNGKVKSVAQYINAWDENLQRTMEALVLEFTDQVKSKQSQNGSKKKKSAKKMGDVQGHGSMSENKEPITAQSTKAVVDEYKWAKEKFKDFLETYVDPEEDAPEEYPFYLRLVESWKELNAVKRPYSVIIHYHHVEHYNQELALAILHDRIRLHKVLSEVFLEFRLAKNCGKKAHLKGKVKIRILGMPSAESVRRFEEFIASNNTKLTEPHPLFDKTTLRSTTYIGRVSGKGYVDFLLKNHRNGKSWNGKFSKSDLVIRDGQFQILTDANEDANINSMRADFVQLTDLLFKFYETDGGAPEYSHAFQNEVLKMESYTVDSREFRVFQRYLSHHLAFKAPLVRAALFTDVWGALQAIRRLIEKGKRDPFHKLQKAWNGKKEKFHKRFITGWFFDKVYKSENNDFNWRYNDGYHILFLELIRHLEVHLHDHTRTDDGNQLLVNTIQVDLMIEKTFSQDASELVYAMMLELDDAEFSNAWEHYEMFECGCGTDLQNTAFEGVKGEVQSGGSESGGAEHAAESSASGSGEGSAPHELG